MSDETDFIDLYGKLRLQPGCSLDDFKRAYRRHVSMWHPDRRRGTRADTLAAARLQRLTAQYGAAMDFHRRHGRLPGAPISARDAERVRQEPEPVPEPVPAAPFASASVHVSAAPQRMRAKHLWVAALVLTGAVPVWSLWPAQESVDTEVRQAAPARPEPRVPAAVPMLTLGMTQDEVLAIEGEPTRRGDDRWEYGPSWVRFEADSLVDWHSSPLRALHAGTSRPQP